MNIANFNKERLAAFCRKNGIKSLKLFGSLARGEARSDSDADLLVEFENGQVPGLFGLIEMENKLSQEFHRPVELITKLNKHVKSFANKDIITLYKKRFAGDGQTGERNFEEFGEVTRSLFAKFKNQ